MLRAPHTDSLETWGQLELTSSGRNASDAARLEGKALPPCKFNLLVRQIESELNLSGQFSIPAIDSADRRLGSPGDEKRQR